MLQSTHRYVPRKVKRLTLTFIAVHYTLFAFRWEADLGGGSLCGQGQNSSCKLMFTHHTLPLSKANSKLC